MSSLCQKINQDYLQHYTFSSLQRVDTNKCFHLRIQICLLKIIKLLLSQPGHITPKTIEGANFHAKICIGPGHIQVNSLGGVRKRSWEDLVEVLGVWFSPG